MVFPEPSLFSLYDKAKSLSHGSSLTTLSGKRTFGFKNVRTCTDVSVFEITYRKTDTDTDTLNFTARTLDTDTDIPIF
jgi:hypothetical protein